MANQAQAVIHNVKGNQIPKDWAQKLHIDPEADADKLFDVIVEPVKKPKKKASLDELRAAAREMQKHTDPSKILTDDDLYDELGLLK